MFPRPENQGETFSPDEKIYFLQGLLVGRDTTPNWKYAADRFVTDKSSGNLDLAKLSDAKSILKDFERSLKKSLVASFQATKSALELRKMHTEAHFNHAESNLKPGLERTSKQAWSLVEAFFKQLKQVSVENSKTTLKKVHDLLYKELDLITSQIAEDSMEDIRRLGQHNETLIRLLDLTNSQILSFVTNEMKTLDINLSTLRDALVEKLKTMGLDKKLNVEFLLLNFQIAKTNSKALQDLGAIFSKRKAISQDQLNQVLNRISSEQSKVVDYIVHRCRSLETLSRNCLQWGYSHPESNILPVFMQKQTESDLVKEENMPASALISAQSDFSATISLQQSSTTIQPEIMVISDTETSADLTTEKTSSISTTTTTTLSTTTTIKPVVSVTPTTTTSLDLLMEETNPEEEIIKDENKEEVATKLGFKGIKNLDKKLDIDKEMEKESANLVKKTPLHLINYDANFHPRQKEYDAENSVKRLKLAVENSLQDMGPNFYLSEGSICIKLSPNAMREIQGL